ncbi:MAG: hypothetical protein ABGW97_11930 [Christiangramia sp.]|uniref:hypothetical protein n=1 Tax=Christiangramia sp. TaxID=1931228 RepID=UPI003241C905
MTYITLQKKRTKKLAMWTGLWVFSLALAIFGSEFLWNDNKVLTIIFILINLGVGIMMIRANILYVKSLDELQRLIALQAMGIALGVAVVGGITYSALDVTNLIGFDAEISHLVLLVGISYLISIVRSHFQFK